MPPLFRTLAISAAFLAGAATAYAQDVNGAGTYGTLDLQSGFANDPRTIQLSAGGSIDSASTVGGRCQGMIASNPDYTLNYNAGDMPLYISVDAQADTTLVVYAPDGFYYCDDDSADDLDPGVYLPKPPAGRYQIWVGTFAGDGGTPPATVYISELNYVHELQSGGQQQPAHLAAPGGNTNYGVVTLQSGFQPDPHTVTVRAGGGVHISDDLPQCAGYVSTIPDVRLNWTAGSLPLIVSVASDVDTTLIVRAPNGAFSCDDDGGEQGMNPSLRFENSQSGAYEIWVGAYASDAGTPSATLNISELRSQ